VKLWPRVWCLVVFLTHYRRVFAVFGSVSLLLLCVCAIGVHNVGPGVCGLRLLPYVLVIK